MSLGRVIRASAGTGKTYVLTSRYMDLLREGVEPREILAITFTRAAAGEIFARVIQRLAREAPGAAPSHAPAGPLRQFDLFGTRASQPTDVLAAMFGAPRARDRRAGEAKGWSDRPAIGTIDSVVARLAADYALDLDLAPSYRMMADDEDEDVFAEAAQRALAEESPERIARLVSMTRSGRGGSEVLSIVARHAREAHAAALDAEPGAWSMADEPPIEPADEALVEWEVSSLARAPLPANLTGQPDANWSRARQAVVDAVRAARWSDVVEKGPGLAILRGKDSFASKRVTEEMAIALAPLVERARAHLLNRFRERVAAMRDIHSRLESHVRRVRAERGGYTFDDLTRAVVDLASRDPRPHERLAGAHPHVLLDEFQDTSGDQFRLLEPLLDEAAGGGGGSFLVVGDAKQSLYSWRRAEPGLLAHVAHRWRHVEPETMTVNRRSSRVVLDVVNRVFGSLRDLGDPGSPVRLAAEEFGRDFEPHTPAKDLPGHVALVHAERAEALEVALARIRAIVGEAPGAGVGVLLRSRAPIAPLIDAIRREGIEASEEGGNPLTDAPAVRAALAALHLADHPDDSAAALLVARSPLARLAIGEGEWWRKREARARAASRIRRTRAERGIGPLLAAWLDEVACEMDARDARRFGQLVELAEWFDERPASLATDFVRCARTTKVEDPASARVRVMTIHASKGLEFDAVVLPEIPGSFWGRAPSVIAYRAGPQERVRAIVPWPDETLQRLDPRLLAYADWSRCRAARESLSVLYVAMTRARRRLDIIVPPPSANGSPSPARLLRDALAPGAHASEPGEELFRVREGDWSEGLAEARDDSPPPFDVDLEASARAPERAADEPRSLADPRPARTGEVLHAWFELIEWLDDGEPTSEALVAALRRSAPELVGEFASIERLFRACLQAQPVRVLLSRPRDGAPVEVRRELSLVVGQASPSIGRADRVVLHGRPVRSATVIDFKSDEATHAPEDLLARHAEQVRRYAQAVADAFRIDPRAIRGVIVGVRRGLVVEAK